MESVKENVSTSMRHHKQQLGISRSSLLGKKCVFARLKGSVDISIESTRSCLAFANWVFQQIDTKFSKKKIVFGDETSRFSADFGLEIRFTLLLRK